MEWYLNNQEFLREEVDFYSDYVGDEGMTRGEIEIIAYGGGVPDPNDPNYIMVTDLNNEDMIVVFQDMIKNDPNAEKMLMTWIQNMLNEYETL